MRKGLAAYVGVHKASNRLSGSAWGVEPSRGHRALSRAQGGGLWRWADVEHLVGGYRAVGRAVKEGDRRNERHRRQTQSINHVQRRHLLNPPSNPLAGSNDEVVDRGEGWVQKRVEGDAFKEKNAGGGGDALGEIIA